jgi:hypothetical protein
MHRSSAMNKGTFMTTGSQELTLSSALSDPLIYSVMTADRVDRVELESMLRQIAAEIARRSRSPDRGGCGRSL